MADKDIMLAKGKNISLIPNWLMLNNAIRTGNLQILAKVLKQTKHGTTVKPNSHSFIFAIWSGNPEMLEEVVKMAKKKHGMDYIPDFHSLAFAVLSGTVAMVDKVMEIASVRKRELVANFELLYCAVWSNNPDMIDKVLSLPRHPGASFPTQIEKILAMGQKQHLDREVLDAVTTSGNPAMLHKVLAVVQKHNLDLPEPTKKTLSQAIKSGNFLMVDEVIKLASRAGVSLLIDEEIYNATDWSDNPAMKSYLESLEQP